MRYADQPTSLTINRQGKQLPVLLSPDGEFVCVVNGQRVVAKTKAALQGEVKKINPPISIKYLESTGRFNDGINFTDEGEVTAKSIDSQLDMEEIECVGRHANRNYLVRNHAGQVVQEGSYRGRARFRLVTAKELAGLKKEYKAAKLAVQKFYKLLNTYKMDLDAEIQKALDQTGPMGIGHLKGKFRPKPVKK